jgi:Divergent InlB B-repeat domain
MIASRRIGTRVVVLAAGWLITIGAGTAFAATHYAAPNGSASNWPCTTTSKPCDLTTAIQGNGSSKPATGDQVILENTGAVYVAPSTITAPVAEDITAASGVIEINGDGDSPVLKLGGFSQETELERLWVVQGGTGDLSDAVVSAGHVTFDDDHFITSGTDGAAAVLVSTDDNLLDSVADDTGMGGTGVLVDVDDGGTVIIRNVTAWAPDDGEGLGAETAGCSTTALDVSIVNTILNGQRTDLSRGDDPCNSGGVIDYQVDHSDLDTGGETFNFNVTYTGTNNITKAANLEAPGSYNFEEVAGSPTIDAGDDSPHDGPSDPDGRPRFLGSEVDIGAYEFPAPYPVTGAATAVTTTSATLSGSVDPEGSDLRSYFRFEYGTTTKYGSQAPSPDGTFPAASTPIPDPHSVSASLTGLKPDTTYDYRLVADNADGETIGTNHTFKTGSPSAPTAQLGLVFAGTGTGTVTTAPDFGGCDSNCVLKVQTATSFTVTATPAAGSKFTGWSGAGCSGTGACALDLGGNAILAATFTKVPGSGPPPTGPGATTEPRITHLTLTGLAIKKPKLGFTVVAGTRPLRSLVVQLPADLRFGKLKHGLKLGAKAMVKLSHGRLTITLAHAAGTIRISIGGHALKVHKTHAKRLTLTVTATDASGGRTRLTAPT